ncbi:MAG: sulfatase [Lentisphaeria bacterium]|nr:sulfatase [Lentisphaeria bacterium]
MSFAAVSRRNFFAQLGGALFAAGVPVRGAERRSPNVVLIYTDDQGYGDAACHGASYPTPNLDRLAAEGVRFTDFYSPHASCSPSRAGLLTGCYPLRVGIRQVLSPSSRIGLNPEEVTIADLLKPLGYATACVGKWHVGHHPEFLPTRQGFDEFFGLPYSNDMWPLGYDGKHKPGSRHPPLPLLEGESVVETIDSLADQDELTTRYTERAVAFIRKQQDQPFFLYLAHSMVHVPLGVSSKFRGRSGQGLFADAVMEIDWSVGEILAALGEIGQDRNTLVVFTSDNGPWLNFGTHSGSVGPLRGGKGNTFDGGQREICLMRWPEFIPAGLVQREPASGIDLLPTIAEATGAALPAQPIDGRSILPLMRGERGARNPHEALLFYYGDGKLEAVRSGRWKLHFPHDYRQYEGFEPGRDGLPGRVGKGRIEWALFDLAEDIGERNNLAEQQPEVVRRLRELAERMDGDIRQHMRPAGQVPGEEPEAVVPQPTVPTPIRADVDGQFLCPAALARIDRANGARYVVGKTRQNIGKWHSLDTVVAWQIKDLPAGRYRVLVRYSLADSLPGSEFQATLGAAVGRGKTRTTRGWSDYQDSDAGILAVPTAGDVELAIQGTRLSGGKCVMNLHSARLVPVP